MNGIPKTTEDRVARKRHLEQDLTTIRTQKAEVLRAIQQIAKKQKTVPLKKLSPEEHRAIETSEHRHRTENIWSQCSKVVAELLRNQNVNLWFGKPVDARFAPNYYTVIQRPMDLGTIKRNLEIRQYADVRQFAEDVRLVFANCRQFNPDPSMSVRKFGDGASDKFERRWVQLQLEVAWDTEMRRHALELERIEAESKSLPEKLKEVTEELDDLTRKAEARAHALPMGGGRDMSFEEKRKLSHALGTLQGEYLARVLDIIAEGPSAPQMDNEEEYELDIDNLDPETLWSLQTFVESVQTEAATKQPGVPAPAAADPVKTVQGSDSEEVGSKGNAGSTFGDHGPDKKAPGGHDLTTFVSATGPGTHQPQILKGTGQKKEVFIQNANAWANLPGSQPGQAVEAVEEDQLWTEFQGREAQQAAAQEERKKAEEAEKARRQVESEAKQKAAEEEETARRAAEAAKVEAERKCMEEQKEKERAQLASIQGPQGGGGQGGTIGHDSAADLAAVGLAAHGEEEDDVMEEI